MRQNEKITFVFVFIVITYLIFPLPFSASSSTNPTYTVISFDGMRHDFTQTYMDEGVLPNFKKVKENGVFAKDIRTIYPSLTAASHAAIATGAKPEKTGMISNNLHQPKTEVTHIKSAFFSPLDVTPIWAEAKKQGKTTATILFPGSNPEEGNKATYAVYYGTTWADSAQEKLTFQDAKGWSELPKSNRPVKEASLSIKLEESSEETIYVLAANTTDGGGTDYDTFYLYTEKNGQVLETVHPNEWGAMSFPINSSHLAGFSFKLKEVDDQLGNVKLYRTAVTSGVIHGPPTFKETIEKSLVIFLSKMMIRHWRRIGLHGENMKKLASGLPSGQRKFRFMLKNTTNLICYFIIIRKLTMKNISTC